MFEADTEKYLKMFLTTANLAAGDTSLSHARVIDILEGKESSKIEMVWFARGLSESSLDTLTGLAWTMNVPVSRLSLLMKKCHVERSDWAFGID